MPESVAAGAEAGTEPGVEARAPGTAPNFPSGTDWGAKDRMGTSGSAPFKRVITDLATAAGDLPVAVTLGDGRAVGLDLGLAETLRFEELALTLVLAAEGRALAGEAVVLAADFVADVRADAAASAFFRACFAALFVCLDFLRASLSLALAARNSCLAVSDLTTAASAALVSRRNSAVFLARAWDDMLVFTWPHSLTRGCQAYARPRRLSRQRHDVGVARLPT